MLEGSRVISLALPREGSVQPAPEEALLLESERWGVRPWWFPETLQGMAILALGPLPLAICPSSALQPSSKISRVTG